MSDEDIIKVLSGEYYIIEVFHKGTGNKVDYVRGEGSAEIVVRVD